MVKQPEPLDIAWYLNHRSLISLRHYLAICVR